MPKTPREEAAYIAGRMDAQVGANLLFAGIKEKTPDLTGTPHLDTSEKCLQEAERLKMVLTFVTERIESLVSQGEELAQKEEQA